MTAIMRFISAYMGFLWEGARYQIVDSRVSTVNGGSSYLELASEALRFRFVFDKGELFLDLRSPYGNSTEWFSIDRVRELISRTAAGSAVLDKALAEFVRDHLETIERLFSQQEWARTRQLLMTIMTSSADKRFGPIP